MPGVTNIVLEDTIPDPSRELMGRLEMLQAMVEDEEAGDEICVACKLTAPAHKYEDGYYFCPVIPPAKPVAISERSPNLGSKAKEVAANIERMEKDDRADAFVPSTRLGGRYPRRK